MYAQLRAHEPVVYLPTRQLWILSRHADVVAALRDPVRFSSDLAGLAKGMSVHPFDPAMRGPRLAALAARIPGVRVLLTSDPPDHTVLRRKVTKASPSGPPARSYAGCDRCRLSSNETQMLSYVL